MNTVGHSTWPKFPKLPPPPLLLHDIYFIFKPVKLPFSELLSKTFTFPLVLVRLWRRLKVQTAI